MKKLFANLALFSLITSLCLVFAPLSFASICDDINNMYASSTCGPQDPSVPNPSGTPCKDAALPASLVNKLVVLTEEPLGAADNSTTFRCSRQIICTVAPPPSKAPAAPPTDGSAAPASPAQATTTTPPLIRTCKTTYVAPSSCSGTATADLNSKLSAPPVNGDTYKICENVMVYVSPAGTNLLYFYMGQIYRYMATLGGVIAVLILIIAGVMRASAGDSSDRVSKANALIAKCISGLVLLFLSAIILYTINPNFFVLS